MKDRDFYDMSNYKKGILRAINLLLQINFHRRFLNASASFIGVFAISTILFPPTILLGMLLEKSDGNCATLLHHAASVYGGIALFAGFLISFLISILTFFFNAKWDGLVYYRHNMFAFYAYYMPKQIWNEVKNALNL